MTEHQPVPMPVIRVAPIQTLSIYQITDEELRELENGSPASLYLNFALALLPAGLSFLITLATTTITNGRVYVVFVVITVVFLVAGLILFALWQRNRVAGKGVVSRIRKRMPPPPAVQEDGTVVVLTARIE